MEITSGIVFQPFGEASFSRTCSETFKFQQKFFTFHYEYYASGTELAGVLLRADAMDADNQFCFASKKLY